eukprot:554566_1
MGCTSPVLLKESNINACSFTKYKWKLTRKEFKQLIQLKTMESNTKIYSKYFFLQNLKWIMELFCDKKSKQLCICLRLSSTNPTDITKCYAQFTIEIRAICIIDTMIVPFEKPVLGWYFHIDKKRNNAMKDLETLYKYSKQPLIITCSINILTESVIKTNAKWFISPVTLYNGQTFKMEWKINKHLLKKLQFYDEKRFWPIDSGRYKSPIFHNLFNIVCYATSSDIEDYAYRKLVVDLNHINCMDNFLVCPMISCKEIKIRKVFYQYPYESPDKYEEHSNYSREFSCSNFIEPFDSYTFNTLTIIVSIELIDCNTFNSVNLWKSHDLLIDKKLLIINYYINKYCYHCIVPKDIVFLISCFYYHLLGDRYCWNIYDDICVFENYHQLTSVEYFSELFEIGNIKWNLILKPEEWWNERRATGISLSMPYFPPNVASITINYRLIVQYRNDKNEITQFSYTTIDRYTYKEHGHSTIYFNDPISKNIKSFIVDKTKQFKIICFVNILKIINKENQMYVNWLNHSNNKYQITWRIDNRYQLKALQNRNVHSYFESNIFYNMWCLRLNVQNDNIWLYLHLCGLPNSVSKEGKNITAELNIYDANIKFGTLSKISDLHYDNIHNWTDMSWSLPHEFHKYSDVMFEMNIELSPKRKEKVFHYPQTT